ncbi:MAG TPA: hypothetical protein VKB84_08690 [Candidatus Binataceae bacterium]|nr:hypothetical protein [Candidatus Binataceae bacterium]
MGISIEIMLGIRVTGEGVGEIRHIREFELAGEAADRNPLPAAEVAAAVPL